MPMKLALFLFIYQHFKLIIKSGMLLVLSLTKTMLERKKNHREKVKGYFRWQTAAKRRTHTHTTFSVKTAQGDIFWYVVEKRVCVP